MKVFAGIYERVIKWSRHRRAPHYLAGLSFAESSFFPIPPDVMLAPMVLARPANWKRFAAIATVFSVLGGLAGYLIGMFAIELITPWLESHAERFTQVKSWFDQYGVWVVFIAGFSPIPYKLFTVSAGALAMPMVPFMLASLVGRGARFFLVSGLIAWGGPKLEQTIQRYVEWLGWLVVVLVAALLLYVSLK